MATTSTWSSTRTPVRRRTGLALLIAIVGVVAAVVIGGVATYQAWRAPDGFSRTAVGGQLSIPMDAAADAVIYYEGQPVPSLADLRLTITSPAGAAVPLRGYEGTLNYDRSDVLATAVGRFSATEAGVYQLVSAAPAGFASLAVGRDLAGGVFLGLGLAALAAVAGIVLALVILRLPTGDGRLR